MGILVLRFAFNDIPIDPQPDRVGKVTFRGPDYQFSVPRAEAITERGMSVAPAMGTAMAINFQPTGGGKAAITGDLVLLGSEVNPVLKTLRDHGIEVTALQRQLHCADFPFLARV